MDGCHDRIRKQLAKIMAGYVEGYMQKDMAEMFIFGQDVWFGKGVCYVLVNLLHYLWFENQRNNNQDTSSLICLVSSFLNDICSS